MSRLSKWIADKKVRWFNINPYKTVDVFTPSTTARINYVQRVELEKNVVEELNIPGKQLVIFGKSGSGKTTLIIKILDKEQIPYVKSHCTTDTTFDSLLMDAFDKLKLFVMTETKFSRRINWSAETKSEIQSIKASMKVGESSSESSKYVRALPYQLTPQKLAFLMGEGGLVWLIEDFHKVAEEEKKRIADLLKIFVDNSSNYSRTKIICIGACDSAEELIALDSNLKNRISEVYVSLLSENNIRSIIKNGFDMLNITIPPGVEEKLIYYSARLGTHAHQMCLDICNGVGINKRSFRLRKLDNTVFRHAINGFIKHNQGTLTSVYEVAIKEEIGWYVLKTLSRNCKEKLALREIKRLVNVKGRNYSDEEILSVLNDLIKPECGVVTYNQRTEKYSLSSPFWEAFLRLQFALESQQKATAERDRNNTHLRLIDQTSLDADVEKQMLDLLQNLRAMQEKLLKTYI